MAQLLGDTFPCYNMEKFLHIFLIIKYSYPEILVSLDLLQRSSSVIKMKKKVVVNPEGGMGLENVPPGLVIKGH